MAKLILPPDGDQECVLDLGGRATVRLGRATTADVVVPRRMASRDHAAIEFDGDSYTLVDRGSYNGTFVNERPISRVSLNHGDRIRIGSYVMRFHLAERLPADLDETQPGDRPAPLTLEAEPDPNTATGATAAALALIEKSLSDSVSSWDGSDGDAMPTGVFQLPDDLDAHFDAVLGSPDGPGARADAELADMPTPADGADGLSAADLADMPTPALGVARPADTERGSASAPAAVDDLSAADLADARPDEPDAAAAPARRIDPEEASTADLELDADTLSALDEPPEPETQELGLEDILSTPDVAPGPALAEQRSSRPRPSRSPARGSGRATPAAEERSPFADWRFWAAIALLALVFTLLLRS